VCVNAHFRFSCPTPRNADTGLKVGPCDVDTNNFTGDALTIAPGPFTIAYEESISHIGAPWRISLSKENSDDLACVLLDHIPHNDLSAPDYNVPATYTKYYIDVIIPDVSCNKCAIQMSFMMTDKNPLGSYCTDPSGTCASVYHSCANVIITGSQPMSNIQCKQPSDWPQAGKQPNNYTQESADWANSFLVGYPSDIVTPVGPCAGK